MHDPNALKVIELQMDVTRFIAGYPPELNKLLTLGSERLTFTLKEKPNMRRF